MKLSKYPNERSLVDEFVGYTKANPIIISNGEERRMFIWGYEVWLPEGKNKTKSGSVDLIGTDNHGDVWLIEAKLCTNAELVPSIWNKQIDPYRFSLTKRSESEIAMSARRFIKGEGTFSNNLSYLDSTEGLFNAFEQWGKFIGINTSEAQRLYDLTINRIQKGEIISTNSCRCWR